MLISLKNLIEVIWNLTIVIVGNTAKQPLHSMKAAVRQAVNQLMVVVLVQRIGMIKAILFVEAISHTFSDRSHC